MIVIPLMSTLHCYQCCKCFPFADRNTHTAVPAFIRQNKCFTGVSFVAYGIKRLEAT